MSATSWNGFEGSAPAPGRRSGRRRQFSERELVELSIIAVAINGWNRLAIAFRSEAGTYRPLKEGGAS